jgi:uncharacterized RDD family membrane protein YckC
VSELPSYPREAAEREEAARPPAAAHDLAPWGRRAAAYVLDSLVMTVPLLLVVVVVLASSPDEDSDAWGLLAIGYLATIVLPFVYFTVLHGGPRGQTLGKRAVAIRVVDGDNGGSIGYGRAFGRYALVFVFWIFVLPALIDYLWPLWDGKSQALHDKPVGSIVVRA